MLATFDPLADRRGHDLLGIGHPDPDRPGRDVLPMGHQPTDQGVPR
jgi:hypothetical protein